MRQDAERPARRLGGVARRLVRQATLATACGGAFLSAVSLTTPSYAQSAGNVSTFATPEWPEAVQLDEVLAPPSQLERLIEFTLMQHPDLAGARAEINREAGLRFQSTRKPNPWVGYSASEVGNDGFGGQQGFYVAQEWVTAGKLTLADNVGNWKTRAAQQRSEVTLLRVSQRVGTQYWEMVAARHRVELLQQLENLLEESVRTTQALQQAAEVERGTVLQAQLEKGQVMAARRQAEANLRASTSALAATVGMDVSFIANVPSDPWPEPSTPADVGNAMPGEWAETQPYINSPELQETQALVEVARWELRLAETQIVSNVDSFASVQRDLATDDTIVGIQVGMALPLLDRKTGLVRAARAEVARSEAEHARRYRDLQARWVLALGDYQAAWEVVREIEEGLLRLAEERLDLARRAHEQGELGYLDLLTAQRSFLAIRQTSLDARQQAAIASVRLETLAVEERR